MTSILSVHTIYQYIQNMLQDTDNNFILDPLSCVIRLAVLSFKPKGTKISINQNKISYNEPCILQGTIRWSQGDNRDDLHNIYKPLIKATEWFSYEKDELNNIFNLAIDGLNKLKMSYNENSTINHSIDRYILVIKNNKNNEQTEVRRSTRLNEEPNETINAYQNHIFQELKQLWNPREITIINNLLIEINDNLSNKEKVKAFMVSLESILDMKEQTVHNLLIKTTTILE